MKINKKNYKSSRNMESFSQNLLENQKIILLILPGIFMNYVRSNSFDDLTQIMIQNF
jgi:hypothetical protein